MQELFSLGQLYVSDFLKDGEQPRCPPVEMKLLLDDNGTVRLEKSAPKDTMWGKYWYRSSINTSMQKELKDIVDSIIKIRPLRDGDLWIDIAANDGYLLSQVPTNVVRIGIDPADDSFHEECKKRCDLSIQNYFTADIFKSSKFGSLKAKVITTIGMFYDLEDPDTFLKDILEVLDDNGIFCLQLSYTPLMLKQLEFSNICHEHFYYYSLFNLKSLFEKNGFQIMDCQLNDTNCGSFRIYSMKQSSNIKLFSSQPYRDICNFRINSLLNYEKTLNLDSTVTWIDFYNRINDLKQKVVGFIKEQRSNGKTVAAYGASTKGNTLLQYFGLDNTMIDFIAERSPYKYGLHTIGTNIPIISEDEMRKRKPDFMLCLPFHFINEFVIREKEYLDGGGKFIVPCPVFEIIGN